MENGTSLTEGGCVMTTGPAITAPPGGIANQSDLKLLCDGELLSLFFQEKVDAAFSTLVERHGPLVFGVCRRVLNDANDAEDAFQATFLVLVRKGATLRDPERLASWLYGVAYRTARKVKCKAALRTKSERQAGEMPSKSDVSEMTYDELQTVLDEEISKLPEKYALPLVLCYLEGKTNAQAAAQLGWPEGSISRRLSRARELLRSRLARRGMAMSVALIAAVFARPATAVIARELLESTTRAATLVAEGAELEDVVSPMTAKLVRDVVTGMGASKFAVPTIAIVALVLLIATTVIWNFAPAAQAANLFHFTRGIGVHGSMAKPGSGQSLAVPGSAGSADGSSCTPAVAPAAAAGSCGASGP
jgi:RNA polymerase sigma factor (sigma-70 family)